MDNFSQVSNIYKISKFIKNNFLQFFPLKMYFLVHVYKSFYSWINFPVHILLKALQIFWGTFHSNFGRIILLINYFLSIEGKKPFIKWIMLLVSIFLNIAYMIPLIFGFCLFLRDKQLSHFVLQHQIVIVICSKIHDMFFFQCLFLFTVCGTSFCIST